MNKALRIGIDVGGTFTHAVAIDHRTLELVRTVCVPTTHAAARGVAEGIAQCLEKLLEGDDINAEDVVFVAHSTTQATNALLEGDTAAVGLLGLVDGVAGARAKKELDFASVPVSGTRAISVSSVFLSAATADDELLKSAEALAAGGAGALVVAQPFAVDDPAPEIRAAAALAPLGLPVTATHQVSGLYGLRARARTSVVNAGILPRMVEVSRGTHDCVQRLGITAPLMIMRSDGGVMDAARMEQTPILTILSGPAAGVSAAVLFEKLSNGLFVEVGGTSTDVSLIRNGRPQRRNAVVGGHVLYLETLDVRTVGVAGGSMVRVKNGKITDVGPRSAHIAGLPYACFLAPDKLRGARMELAAPKSGDPADYAVLVLEDGSRAAITTTCAANAAGLLPDDDYAAGNSESATIAIEQLGAMLGAAAAQAARDVLSCAADKVAALCTQLITDYECRGVPLVVVGGGGGASVVAPRAAEKLGLEHRRANAAPVISAVGVGMALMKELVEKSVVNPGEDDVRAARSEVIKKLTDAGCDPATIEVEVDVDARRGVVRASAVGASVLTAEKKQDAVTEDRARELAAAELGLKEPPQLVFADPGTFVFQGAVTSGGFLGMGKKTLRPTAVVDARGIVKLDLKNARIYKMDRAAAADVIKQAIDENTIFGDGGAVLAPAFLVYGGKVTDLSKAGGPEPAAALATTEVNEAAAYSEFCIVAQM